MNVEEMRAAIEAYENSEDGEEDFLYNLLSEDYTDEELKGFEEATGIKIQTVDSFRSEGSGDYDEWTMIFKFNDIYVRFLGYYSSHNGTEMDTDFTEVKMIQKLVNVWVSEEENKGLPSGN